MTTPQHLLFQASNKFRFVVAALLFVVGLLQVSALALNTASANYQSSKYLHYKENIQKASPSNFLVEKAEIEEERDDDDDKQHDTTVQHFVKNDAVLSYTVSVVSVKKACLRIVFSQNTSPQPIPLYALHCNWRHHLA